MKRNEYALNSFEEWRRVLDESMAYHFAEEGPSDNLFDNAVINTFKYFEGVRTVLDVGAGWGAPARLLKKHLGVDVTCLTNGEGGQVEALEKDFPVIFTDADEWAGDGKWDMLMFFDSFGHMDDGTLNRFAGNADRLLFKERFFPTDSYSAEWDLRGRTRQTYFRLIEEAGFEVKDLVTTSPEYYRYSASFWLRNIQKFEKEERRNVTGHIATLKSLCQQMLFDPAYSRDGVVLFTLYAEKVVREEQ